MKPPSNFIETAGKIHCWINVHQNGIRSKIMHFAQSNRRHTSLLYTTTRFLYFSDEFVSKKLYEYYIHMLVVQQYIIYIANDNS